jgi:hypothetical protein
MNSRKLTILAALAAVVIAIALFLSHQRSSTQANSAPELLYPKLQAELNSVTAVSIYKPGDERAVELTRKDGSWVVTERAGYAADTAKVHRLLRAIAEAKPVEQKTSNPASYAAIGVEDVSDPKATGARVQLTGSTTPVNLIVGKSGVGAQSVFVRRAGEPASWLLDTTIEAPANADAWLRKEILNVAFDRVQSATVTTSGGKPYTAAKKSREDTDFAVDNVPKGKELSSPAAANGVGSALNGLTLVDARPAKEFESEKPAAHATIKTFDGLVAQLDGWTKDGKRYIAVKPAYDEAQAKQFHVEKPAAEKKDAAAEGQPPAPPATPAVDAKEEAKTAEARLAGWVYEIPDYKYEAIFKPLDELLKK